MTITTCETDSVAAPQARPMLDRAHLTRVTLGSRELAREVLGLFVAQVPSQIEALAASPAGRGWYEAAHGLKGSARAIGACALADIAASAERMAGEAIADKRRDMLAAIRSIAAETLAVAQAEAA